MNSDMGWLAFKSPESKLRLSFDPSYNFPISFFCQVIAFSGHTISQEPQPLHCS